LGVRKRKGPVELQGAVWLTADGETLGGSDRVELLRAVGEHGSITQAARAVAVSYKTAWDAIDTMNRLAGAALVERNIGGQRGGGSRLTALGRRLVERFEQIEAAHQRFVRLLGDFAVDLSRDFDARRMLNMKTSARNQFMGTVSGYKAGAVNDEVELRLSGGARIVAIVTHGSTEQLGLKMGASAFALVKASSVLVATDLGDARLSARNQLPGTVVSVSPGAVNAEVVIDVGDGTQIAAIVTQVSVNALGLQVGAPATAFFKASSVIIGTMV
jgi:molybdate transport system regulatory protein